MDTERLFKLRVVLRAFNLRDLQTAGAIMSWATDSGFSFKEIHTGARLVPALEALERAGYLDPSPSVEKSRDLKRIEDTLPKDIKRELRKVRLNASSYGYQKGKGG